MDAVELRCAGTLLLLLLTSSNRQAWDATSSQARRGLPCLLAWQMSLRRGHDGERFQPRGPVPRRTVRAIGPNAELAISILFLAFCAVATGATLYLIWTAVRILVSLVW